MVKPVGAACNLGCKYCFYLKKAALYPGGSHRMSLEVLETFTRQYIAAEGVPEVTFGWQGGEPLLAGLPFYQQALALQKKHARLGMKISNTIQTNGTLLDDSWSKFLHDNNFLVGISIDGPPALHDAFRVDKAGRPTFKQVRKGLNVLARNHVEFNVLCCVHAANQDHPLEVYRYLRDVVKAKFIQFIPVVEPLDRAASGGLPVSERTVSPAAWSAFLDAIYDEWVKRDVGTVFVQLFDATLASWLREPPAICVFSPACGTAVALEHNGDVYSCDHFVDPEHLLGNIMDADLGEIVFSAQQKAFGTAKAGLSKECLECDVQFACHGECPKNRLPYAGGLPVTNYLCEGYKAFFDHVKPTMDYMANELRHERPAASVMDKRIRN
jgi:uncharacterized protein